MIFSRKGYLFCKASKNQLYLGFSAASFFLLTLYDIQQMGEALKKYDDFFKGFMKYLYNNEMKTSLKMFILYLYFQKLFPKLLHVSNVCSPS